MTRTTEIVTARLSDEDREKLREALEAERDLDRVVSWLASVGEDGEVVVAAVVRDVRELWPDDETPVIEGGKRNGIYKVSEGIGLRDWWCAYSPRNGTGANAEGPWADWVELAREILKADEERRNG